MEFANNLNDTTGEKPVMLNGVLLLLLCWSSGYKPNPDLRNPGFPFGGHLLLFLFLKNSDESGAK
jgi:hypothetical protein